jgi:hypothetical protein
MQLTGFVNHGVSKSKRLKKFARKHGLKVKKLKLSKSQLSPEDFMGLPAEAT